MKRLFLSVITVLGLSTACFAKDKVKIGDWSMEKHLPQLVRYLDLNSKQYDNVENAIQLFSDKMLSAKYYKGKRQIKHLNEAVYGNLKLMKSTLNDVQYRKYLQLINTTLRNKGLDSYIFTVSK